MADAVGPGSEETLPRPTTPVPPELSVILLTRNEAPNVDDALRSLVSQELPLEVVVVDSASTDATVERVRSWCDAHPARVRLVASERDIPIGEARNLGLEHARATRIAFMSADATAAPGWASALVAALHKADVVYGRQEHDPPGLSVAAAVRGLRYHHFPDTDVDDPDTYASNVNAGIRRDVFDQVRYVSDRAASALDDILFTRDVRTLGLTVVYEPRMLVRHKDASTLKMELRKNRREGYGWGILAPALGLHRTALAWGAMLFLGLASFLFFQTWWLAVAWAFVLYAPALRRVVRSGGRLMHRPHLLLAALIVSPLFDLAFLFDYLRGLRHRRPDVTGILQPQGA
jgi:glycosyltransferase involved in cell wall biosynthesis